MSTVLTYSPPMAYSYSRHSNSAGSPLPGIPRRSSSSSRSVSLATSLSASSISSATISPPRASSSAAPTMLVVQPPTPPRVEVATPDADGASSSSSGSESYVQMNPRVKRVRTPKMQSLRSPAESTPTPAVFRAQSGSQPAQAYAFPARHFSLESMSGNETPRASSSHSSRAHLHIDLDTVKKPIASSANVVRSEGSSRAVSAPHATEASIARKKSGEPLKSSLKARRPVVRGNLSIITGASLASTKSEPTTPSSKSVHFDSRLEHVKLFLAEQKPLAISREGSPTDTSGTESDFPSAIYGSKKAEDKVLTMQLTNKPPAPRPDADLYLDDLSLGEDGTSLVGRVRVRNIAFEKWVAVRFTVDAWQTTSEVTGKYLDSVPGGVFDRFTFTIRLGDMLARIEEKTLFFALRFNVVGREIWDNNSNDNYKVTFAKVPRVRSISPSSSAASSESESNLSSLKSKLENVAKGQETVGSFMSHGRKPPTLNASTSLSARYDFATSFKSPWARSPVSASPTKSSHARTVTYPHIVSQFPKRVGKVAATFEDSHTARGGALTRGSPRIADPFDNSPLERPATAFYPSSELEDTPVAIMSRRRNGPRNHQRGYFDIGLAQTSPSVRRTPPSSACSSPTKVGPSKSMGTSTSSKELAHGGWFLEMALAGSEESTPSATSNSESSSPSESPTEDREGLVYGFGSEVRSGSPAESDSYSMFLNRYCYYTGGSDSLLDAPPEAIHRSHSASSVEEFLSTSPGYLLSPGETPTRSSSFDDVVAIGSGAATPTMRSVAFMQVGSPQLV